MVAPLTPEGARGWLGTILAVTDRATSITLVFLLVTGGIMGWYLLGELRRVHDVNLRLYGQLQESHKAHLDMALRCDCEKETR